MSQKAEDDNEDNEKTPLLAGKVPTEEKVSSFLCIRKDIFILYCDSALSAWGDRMWSFAVSLFLANLTQSLRLTAVYGFTTGISAIIFGTAIGKWIDNTSRLRAARTALILQNFFVAACAALLCVIFVFFNSISDLWLAVCQGCVIVIAVLADLASITTTLTISRDWLPVIAQDNNQLSHMNAMIRRIDLTTLICAPIVAGQVMTYSGGLIDIENSESVVAAICLAGWNIVSVCVEYKLVTMIYHATPDLAFRNQKPIAEGSTGLSPADDVAVLKQPQEPEKENFYKYAGLCCSQGINNLTKKLSSYVDGWKIYFKQDMLAAGIGLSFLFMTVLSFDSVTLGYAKLQGISEAILGGLSAVGAVIGILGTVAYPFLRTRIGIERTGMCGFFLEAACLSTCVVSLWLPGSPFEPEALFSSTTDVSTNHSSNADRPKTSIALLMTGIVTARFGLWMADLSINQIIQERVDESCRGTVFGAQSSINNSMSTLKYTLVILLPDPKTFGYLIITSFIFICLGWVAFGVYACRKKEHLLPVDKSILPDVIKHPQMSTETALESHTETLVT